MAMRDPFKIDSPTCISFSGGRTSAYMLHRVLESNGGLPKEAVVCFANTGKEDEATLRFVRDCNAWLYPKSIWWLEYNLAAHDGVLTTSFDGASRNGEPFAALIDKKNYLPNPVARFCTSDLKVKPIEAFMRRMWDEFDMMVGVRADEMGRVPKLRARGLLVPLVNAGVTQVHVQDFWKTQPFNLGIPYQDGGTPRGNCDLCFLKGPNQIKSLIAQKHERAVWWAKQEEKIGATFRSDRPSYAAMLANAQNQTDAFGHDEGAAACFCGD